MRAARNGRSTRWVGLRADPDHERGPKDALGGEASAWIGDERRPDLKVLFITGYAENAAAASGFLDPGREMITKPFAVESLAIRIRQIIEQ